jgi:hypothetical protein
MAHWQQIFAKKMQIYLFFFSIDSRIIQVDVVAHGQIAKNATELTLTLTALNILTKT